MKNSSKTENEDIIVWEWDFKSDCTIDELKEIIAASDLGIHKDKISSIRHIKSKTIPKKEMGFWYNLFS